MLASVQACPEKCPDDSPDGRCPPACEFCGCCAVPRTLPPEVAAAWIGPTVEQCVCAHVDAAPASAEPHEILHVPKTSLA